MSTVHRSEIATDVSKRLGVSRAKGQATLEAVLESIQESLVAGDAVAVMGFGRFDVANVAPRQVKPVRGAQQVVSVPAHRRVRFKPGSTLNGAVDNQWHERLLNRAKRFLRR